MRKDGAYTGTHSVFPAPLAELIILRYGGPEGGLILDAFAGGPPRGTVSALMRYRYVGFELRKDQIDSNLATIDRIDSYHASTNQPLIKPNIEYRCSDGTVLAGVGDQSIDFAFTCPPYYKHEPYSDEPNDLTIYPRISSSIRQF